MFKEINHAPFLEIVHAVSRGISITFGFIGGHLLRYYNKKHESYLPLPVILKTRNPVNLYCRNLWNTLFPEIEKKLWIRKRGCQKNYNPAIRSIAPSRIPNMDVDADNIPKTIYPTIIPTFSGM